MYKHFLMGCIFLAPFLDSLAQEKAKPRYVSMSFIKSTSPEFIKNEKEYWTPVYEALIQEGRKIAGVFDG